MTDLEFFTKSFMTFFVIIGPIDLVVIFMALTAKKKSSERHAIAFRGSFIAFWILVFFTFFGTALLKIIGISVPVLKTTGGALLMVVAYKMVFDTDSHSVDYGEEEEKDAKKADDISVFPIATPLLAGAGSMSSTILFASEAEGDVMKYALLIGAFGSVLIITYILFAMAGKIQAFISPTITNIITRVMGILLAALSLQFIIDGLTEALVF